MCKMIKMNERNEKKLNAKYVENGDVLEVYTPFSWNVVRESKALGGKFNREKSCWTFPKERLFKIQEKLGKRGEIVKAKVPISKTEGKDSITIGWYVLASRKSRDSQANINSTLISGEIPNSGGSMKYPSVNASNDSVFSVCMYRDFAEKQGLEFEEIETEETKRNNKIAEIKKMMEEYNITVGELE